MKKIFRIIIISLPFITPLSKVEAQSVSFATDALERGYYDRPWQRYEAEPSRCETNGEFLEAPVPYTQEVIQSEASNQTALVLNKKDDYVEWIIDNTGRGLTLRFSLPDAPEGKGLTGKFSLYVDDIYVQDIEVSSFWAWQYTQIGHSDEKYPDNTPSDDKFPRMRFDETYVLLENDVPNGASIKIAKSDDNNLDYVIDFIELEPVDAPRSFKDIDDADKVMYDHSTSLSGFISKNGGKTIYIPEGTYELSRQLILDTPGTKLIGAGMWHTRLYFSTPSDNRSGYNARGLHCNVSDMVIDGMSIDTANDKRYFENKPSMQVGKGLNGSWGSNSIIRDVRIDHFECGAWISGSVNLRMERCRFRNNYADGVNLSGNSANCIVTHCSFRNNGDDDMASWSTGGMATDNEFSYCTAENNWRASSLGFFGGQRGRAHHIAIFDALEAGARAVCDFPGSGFSHEGCFEFSDISIYRSGCKQGTPGVQGGFWGTSAASFQFGAGYAYDLLNINAVNIDIYDSRFDAISIKSNSGKRVENLNLSNINIINVEDYNYGINIGAGVKGYGTYCNIHAEGVVEPFMSDIPSGFNFTSASDVKEINDCKPCGQSSICHDLNGVRVSGSGNKGLYVVTDSEGKSKIMIRDANSL